MVGGYPCIVMFILTLTLIAGKNDCVLAVQVNVLLAHPGGDIPCSGNVFMYWEYCWLLIFSDGSASGGSDGTWSKFENKYEKLLIFCSVRYT